MASKMYNKSALSSQRRSFERLPEMFRGPSAIDLDFEYVLEEWQHNIIYSLETHLGTLIVVVAQFESS